MAKYKSKTLLFIFFLFLAFSGPLFSQRYFFKSLSLADGLSQSQVFAITEDELGRLWIGTIGGGIDIYDGQRFNNISTTDGLSSNVIYRLFSDKSNNIWIGTIEGLNVYDGYQLKVIDTLRRSVIHDIVQVNQEVWVSTPQGIYIFENFTLKKVLNTAEGLLHNNVKKLIISSDGSVLIAYGNNNLSFYKNGEFWHIYSPDFQMNPIECGIYLDQRYILLGTERGLYTFDSQTKKSQKLVISSLQGRVNDIKKDIYGNVWALTHNQSLHRLKDLKCEETFNEDIGLPSKLGVCLWASKTGALWVGTNGAGFYEYSKKNIRFLNKLTGMDSEVIMSIQEYHDSTMVFASYDGRIYWYRKGTKLRQIFLTDSLPIQVSQIVLDRGENLWVASGSYLYKVSPSGVILEKIFKASFHLARIMGVYPVDDENILVYGEGGVYMYNSINKKINPSIYFSSFKGENIYLIKKDLEDRYWVLCRSKFFRIDQTGQIKRYNEKDGLPSLLYISFYIDSDNTVWIASEKGLYKNDGKGFRSFNKSHGLSSNIIFSILKHKDRIYLGTSKGIDVLRMNSRDSILAVENYNQKDGIFGLEFNRSSIFLSQTEEIYMGNIKGVCIISGEANHSIIQEKKEDVKTYIKAVEIDGKKWTSTKQADMLRWTSLPNKLEIPYQKNNLTIRFISPQEIYEHNILYSYQLKGFSESWSMWSGQSFASFTNIPPGRYILQVKTRYIHAKESIHVLQYEIVIHAPFWQTLWFKIILFLGIIAGVSYYFIFQSRRLRRLNKRLELKVEHRTRELQNQKESFEHFSYAMSATTDGMLIADSEGNIEWINQGLTNMVGYSLPEIRALYGKTLQEISTSPEIKSSVELFQQKKLQNLRYEAEQNHKLGYRVFMNANITPSYDQDGNLKKIIAIYSDITDLKNKEMLLQRQNKDITDNIIYSKYIQEAILPSKNILSNYNPDSFIVHMPKDIVSGDFYWFKGLNDYFVMSLADCTGHGVHSAFLSMIGNEYLHQLINSDTCPPPNQVLKDLDLKVRTILKSNEEIKNINDGMDIALCFIQKDKKKLLFSGANRGLYIIRDHELIEIKGQKCAIGDEKDKVFEVQEILLKKGDLLYLFSDGYQDQFGGPHDKKITLRRLKKLLLDVHTLPMIDQKNVIIKNFNFWKGKQEQVDDVLILGFRV